MQKKEIGVLRRVIEKRGFVFEIGMFALMMALMSSMIYFSVLSEGPWSNAGSLLTLMATFWIPTKLFGPMEVKPLTATLVPVGILAISVLIFAAQIWAYPDEIAWAAATGVIAVAFSAMAVRRG